MHRWIGADGVTIAADSFGQSSDPTLVLLHGGGQTRHSWRSTAEKMAARGFHVVTVDARGHGDSDWSPAEDYDEAALVRDLALVVQSVGSAKPIIAGASAGGATALAAVGMKAVDAAALILVDIVPHTEAKGYERVRSFMLKHEHGFGSLEEVAEVVSGFRKSTRPAKLDGLVKNLRRTPDGRYHWHWDPSYLDARHRDLLDRHERLARYAQSLTVPTLLIRGGSSDVVSEEGAREFLQLCPHAEYANVPEAGHMLVGDDNDVFGSAATPFLRKLAL